MGPDTVNVAGAPLKPTTAFRLLLQRPGCTAAIGAHDPSIAKLVEGTGFEVICASGSSTSTVLTGYPDVGLVSFTEMVTHARNIIAATTRPVFCDADTGFGNATNVRRTIREYEAAGAAGLFIEDQTFPKRCGQTVGADCIPLAEMLAKIYGAKEAQHDPDFVLVVRTDAYEHEGIEGVVRRSRAYVEAGADAILPMALPTVEDFRACREALDVPLITDIPEWGRAPMLSLRELGDVGFSLGVYAVSALRVALYAVRAFLADLERVGTQEPWLSRMMMRADLDELLGLSAVRADEERLARRAAGALAMA